ncbi:hypothetical protein FisN_26Hh039 [Fistulifera solaris]|uniref:HMG box domain-containing protein n=1 Tax=Fistulifera solaris TaxID=1519565 RepID=A0A1Z5JXY4_FISSO|nr:hypothetical protein FisN_26Hh039 [Fistulifera solaris]|eukprot:GAX18746.1 hypothetical protein FisN_26Hh039 [Fistulifera solaris]
MYRPRQKQDKDSKDTDESSSQSHSAARGSSQTNKNDDSDASQCLPFAAPNAASYIGLSSYDSLLLSLANSDPLASLSQQPLYSAQTSLPLMQDIPLQSLAALNSNWLGNPFASVPALPSMYQQSSPLLLDPLLSFHPAPPMAARLLELSSNSLQVPLPQVSSLIPSARLQNISERVPVETHVERNVEESARNHHDLDGSARSMQSIPKPKRPLSAYNFFFQAQRQQLIQSEGNNDDRKRRRSGISFEDLAREISERWRNVDPDTLQYYDNLARADKERYLQEMDQYKHQHDSELTRRRLDLESTVPEETMARYMRSQAKKPKKRKKDKKESL